MADAVHRSVPHIQPPRRQDAKKDKLLMLFLGVLAVASFAYTSHSKHQLRQVLLSALLSLWFLVFPWRSLRLGETSFCFPSLRHRVAQRADAVNGNRHHVAGDQREGIGGYDAGAGQ